MCTAISDKKGRHIFGRTLDLEYSLDEAVVLTPRHHRLNFLHCEPSSEHYAILGAACVAKDVPLYYDAVNEEGLCAAALSFPHFCGYGRARQDAKNFASFELIPTVLSRARTTEEARSLLDGINITDENFSGELPATPLHWIFADKKESITVESIDGNTVIYDNSIGILTNSPPFIEQLTNLERYAHIIYKGSRMLALHSRGLDGFGIPGDASSGSRFVRAAYLLSRTEPEKSQNESVSRFFHIMDGISQSSGASHADNGTPVRTVYTSAIDTDRLEYNFTTYENRRIRRIKLDIQAARGENLAVFPMHSKEDILPLN